MGGGSATRGWEATASEAGPRRSSRARVHGGGEASAGAKEKGGEATAGPRRSSRARARGRRSGARVKEKGEEAPHPAAA